MVKGQCNWENRIRENTAKKTTDDADTHAEDTERIH